MEKDITQQTNWQICIVIHINDYVPLFVITTTAQKIQRRQTTARRHILIITQKLYKLQLYIHNNRLHLTMKVVLCFSSIQHMQSWICWFKECLW